MSLANSVNCDRKLAKIGESVGNAQMLKVSNQVIQIEDLESPSENKNGGEDKIENSRENTPNTGRSNITRRFDAQSPMFDI